MTDTNIQPDYLGHRQRLRERFLSGGGKDMADYELLELLLTIAIPRRDVKPIAKALIRKFGSFARVINADRDDLFEVSGVKESAYTVFRIINAALERVTWQNLHENELPVLHSPALPVLEEEHARNQPDKRHKRSRCGHRHHGSGGHVERVQRLP